MFLPIKKVKKKKKNITRQVRANPKLKISERFRRTVYLHEGEKKERRNTIHRASTTYGFGLAYDLGNGFSRVPEDVGSGDCVQGNIGEQVQGRHLLYPSGISVRTPQGFGHM